MLIAIVAIAVLTTVAAELAFSTRVDLQMAANQRDEIRAYYLARSGVGMARLLLQFQRQLDAIQLPRGLTDLLSGKPPTSAGAPGAPAAPPAAGGGLSIQLWSMAHLDCHTLQGLVTSDVDPRDAKKAKDTPKLDFDDENPDLAAKQQQRSFGGFEGCFQVTIGDEEQKINLSKLSEGQSGRIMVGRLLDMLSEKRFEFLFEKEDSNRVKVTPPEVVLALHDWIDDDEVQSTLNLALVGQDPFLRGFSDENGLYDKYDPRYKAKNARFDSLDEILLVHGINDRFMAAFRDRLTVFPDRTRKLNINTRDPVILAQAILSVMDPRKPDPRLTDPYMGPLYILDIIRKIELNRIYANFGLGMTAQDFVAVVKGEGIAIDPQVELNPQLFSPVEEKSETFSIKSVGEAGSVQKTITAVVRNSDGPLGKVLYWKEE